MPTNCLNRSANRFQSRFASFRWSPAVHLAVRGSMVLAMWTLLAMGAPAAAAPRIRPIVDPNDAGPDFRIQGEYEGTLPDGSRYGVQVIALGDNEFRAVGYRGGLPGNGWDLSEVTTTDARGEAEQRVVFESVEGRGVIDLQQARHLALRDAQDQPVGELARVERRSPTLGQAPPEGAVVLFDGEGDDREAVRAWRGGRSKGGLLQVGGQTVDAFEDFVLHLEFQTPYMPSARGQDRGNSGVYLQRRYEIQILDSFGLSGADNECGAIYRFRRPDVNMCLPPLAWQTYDVDFRMARFDEGGQKVEPARLSVRHNGVPIHQELELTQISEGPWRSEDTAEGGPLYLQFHGAPVQFRNIWIVPKKVEQDS